MKRELEVFDGVVVRVLVVMLALSIAAAMANLVWVFVKDLVSLPFDFLTVAELLDAFSAFLVVLIGLELLGTVKLYATERHLHVEDVLLVAMVAVLRKVITLDSNELPATTLIAVAAVIVALAAAYWLMRRSMGPRRALQRLSAGRPGTRVTRRDPASRRRRNARPFNPGVIRRILDHLSFSDSVRSYPAPPDPSTAAPGLRHGTPLGPRYQSGARRSQFGCRHRAPDHAQPLCIHLSTLLLAGGGARVRTWRGRR